MPFIFSRWNFFNHRKWKRKWGKGTASQLFNSKEKTTIIFPKISTFHTASGYKNEFKEFGQLLKTKRFQGLSLINFIVVLFF